MIDQICTQRFYYFIQIYVLCLFGANFCHSRKRIMRVEMDV